MIYLLDTNVVSETIKKVSNAKVVSWLKSIDSTHFSISVITLGEIRKGAEKLSDMLKKQQIVQWLEIDLMEQFHERILPIDERVADKWGYLCSKHQIGAVDALIAATALVYNQKLATRNSRDFSCIEGLELVNPWA